MIVAGICMTKCLREVIKHITPPPPYFGLYVDDGFCRHKKGAHVDIGRDLNNFHPKLKFTVENEPSRFLDSEFVKSNSTQFSIKVFQKPNKLPIHWTSQTPRRYKRNAIICELHRAFRISDDFDSEVIRIKSKYANAGFPLAFIEETISNFRFSNFEELIPRNFFENPDESKPTIRIRLPFCRKNENLSKIFLKKLFSFTGDSFKIFIIWNTHKIRTLFPLKDRNLHPHCIIYEGTCSCGVKYIGETDRCMHLRTGEHEDIKKASEPAKHLKINRDHCFTWKILAHAPRNGSKRKILEAFFISKYKPGLNEQVFSRKLAIFKHGVT